MEQTGLVGIWRLLEPFVSVPNRVGMKFASKPNGTELVVSMLTITHLPTPKRMGRSVTTFALIRLQGHARCRCAASTCCLGLLSSWALANKVRETKQGTGFSHYEPPSLSWSPSA
eukprot:1134459-Pelagomonas_calceolata.AAC.1